MRLMRTFGIGCLLIAGCAETGAPPVETPAGTMVQPIYGGLPPDAPEHAAVIGIHQRSGDRVSSSPFCSGTLITPEVVLTAAHCLDNARGGKTFKTATPDSIAIYFGDGVVFDQTPLFYPVVETLIHPGYDRNALRNDLGLIRLAFPMNDIAPVPNLPSALALSNADIGSPLNFAGFGYAEDRSFGVKLQADTPLGGFGCSVAGCSGGSDAATQISYSQQDDGPCNGDSGGPAFAYRGGQAYVAGITSYGDSGCTIYGVSTRVDAFQPVIDDFVNGGGDPPPACGADGVCEAGCADDPDCNGGPGGGACGDGVCGDGESCDGRSGTSACPSDCAGRTGGRPSGRYCYVEGACEGPGCP